MVSFLPAATELRSDLKQLGNSDAVTWVDVTAPGDGCSFALCDHFEITAGPHTLRDRFQGRASSPSRIVTQTTRYGDAQ